MLLRWYFDVIVATKEHLYIVFWESFFSYRIKILTWSSIQDISFSAHSGLSVLWKDADISIATEQDDLISFDHVYQADQVVKKLYDIRERYIDTDDRDADDEYDTDEQDETPHTINDEKFHILVETLGEVIVDYMKKKE